MKRMKRWLALLLSAALALSLLAGCGNGSRALSQVVADLLSNQYDNVSVKVDSDLTAALKKAVAEGGTEEEILAALVNNLNLSGVNVSFDRLDGGQQGDHGVDLVFQPGADPDAAAHNAQTQWSRVLRSLPNDGSYSACVAMIEAENGYYIAVDVEVLKAGTPDNNKTDEPSTPDPEPEEEVKLEDFYVTNTLDLTDEDAEELYKFLKEQVAQAPLIQMGTNPGIHQALKCINQIEDFVAFSYNWSTMESIYRRKLGISEDESCLLSTSKEEQDAFMATDQKYTLYYELVGVQISTKGASKESMLADIRTSIVNTFEKAICPLTLDPKDDPGYTNTYELYAILNDKPFIGNPGINVSLLLLRTRIPSN